MMDQKREQIKEKQARNDLQVLMDLYSEDLFIFVRGIVHSNETAEELVSDVFVSIWNKRDEVKRIINIKAYLFILARNQSISFIRKNKKRKIVSLEDVSEYHFVPLDQDETSAFEQEMIDQINEAIELLPAKCKMAFSLAKISNLKYKEIGEIMGISPLTVKNHIAYALEKIYAHVSMKKDFVPGRKAILLFISRLKPLL